MERNQTEEGKFSLVKMLDYNVYLKIYERIQKLELMETKNESTIYRIENEAFGWNYIYESDGTLTLVDSDKNELIEYISAE